MQNRLRQWLSVAVAQDSVERQPVRIFQVLLIAMMGVALAALVLVQLIEGPVIAGQIATAGISLVILIILAALFLLRRSLFSYAVLTVANGVIIALTITLISRGLRSGSLIFFALAIPITLVGLLSGRRALILSIGLSIAGIALTGFLESMSSTVAGFTPVRPSRIIIIIGFSLIASLLGVCVERFGTALREALVLLQAANERLRIELHERKQTEAMLRERDQALKEAHEQLTAILENAPAVAIQVYETDGSVTFWNKASEQLYQYRAEEIVGQRLAGRVLSSEDAAEFEAVIQQLLATNESAPLREWSTLTASGQHRSIISSLFPIRFGPNTRQIVCMDVDITERKRAEERQHFLASASTLLASSLDYETTLQSVAHLTVEHLADWCVIDILEEDGQIQRLAVVHNDPTKAELARELQVRYRPDPTSKYEVTAVLRSGVPRLIANYEDVRFVPRGRDERHRALIEALGVTSYMQVPLQARGRTIGVITLATDSPQRPYGPDDLALAEELARRAATAIDQARLYRAAQEAVQRKDEALALLDAVFENAPVGLAFHDRELRYLRINDALARMNGVSAASHLGRTIPEVVPHLAPTMLADLEHVLATGVPIIDREESDETLGLREQHGHWLVSYYPVPGADGEILGVGTVAVDITEHKHLEAQLRQSQKMEGIGRLAGGIAHDFNNLLTAILGYTDLALMSLDPDHPVSADLSDIKTAALRAGELTHQLLAFARKQVIKPRVLNLNILLANMDKLLRRLIGEDIELVTHEARELKPVKVDPGQIEQVLVNLAVNARDAMPRGGKLTITTANVMLDQEAARQQSGLAAGWYVRLTVSDTGVGMTDEVQRRLFEPFFTTKEVGQGTGLGLATCYGIIKQHGGHILVESTPSHGTTFDIYLPPVEELVEALSSQASGNELPRGTETVLLVEDEPALRALAARVLRTHGYSVIEAADGDEALRIAREQHQQWLHMLVTDVVMPKMSGKTLADRLIRLYPDVKVLFISGYTENTIIHHGQIDPGIAFLQKPFSPAVLVRKVHEVLHAPPVG